jgi:hypothetical protein
MSILERGKAEAEQRAKEQAAREERWREQTHQRVINDFWQQFYKDRIILNPEYKGWGSQPRRIWDPDNMPPVIENWSLLPGEPVSQGASTFICEGITYICRWQYRSGGDRADWDDGWWPDWFVVTERRRFLWTKRVETQVWGPAQVAEVVSG